MNVDAAAAADDFGVRPPGGELPAALRLGRVRLQVGDLERSLDFYQRVVGVRVGRRLPGGAFLFAEEDSEPLLELREWKGAAPAPRRGRPGLYHFAVLLPDRRALGRLVAHLDASGVRFGAADHLVSESIYLHDPDGLGIEVYADRPRSAWRRRGEELVMDTLPLDLAGLVREAGGGAWSALPASTAIGHLHLHVTDLARAAAFYHVALGLRLTVRSYPGALFLAAPGYHHHLGLNTWAADPTPPPDDQARLLDWEIRLPDSVEVGRAGERLAAAGWTVDRDESGDAGHAVAVGDPWGTVLRLTAASG